MIPWQSKVHSTCTAMSEKQIFLGQACKLTEVVNWENSPENEYKINCVAMNRTYTITILYPPVLFI